MSARLKTAVRTYDVLGRYGGEEFLAMLPHTNLAEAEAVAERMRQAIAAAPFDIGGNAIRVTASLGVTQSPDVEDEVNAVIRRADEALYRAKNGGRNRVVSVA